MTALTITVRGLNGSVIPNTSFKITAGYPDDTYDPEISMTSVVTFTTDNDGEATVTLTPGIAPYFLSRAAGMVDDVIAYKFYVPIGSTAITLGLVYVDLKTQFKLLNDKSLYSLIESKVAMLACLEQAKVSAAAANESKELTADYLSTVETVIGEGISGHIAASDPHGDRAYVDTATAAITQTGAIATAMFINRLDHFIGDEDPACFTVTSFNNSQGWSDTLRGNITGANAWRGVAIHQVSTGAGQRRFNFGGGYADSIAGAAGGNLNWVAGDKYQFIWRGAISAVPDGSNQFCLTFGFSNRESTTGYNPSVTAGYSHAFIWADEASGFWKCYSRSATGASEESTTTAVAVAANTEITIHVVIATTGNVEFYINNVLVATHSGIGKIQVGDKLIPILTWQNKATIAATRYLYSDCVGYLMVFSSQAAGLAWR